jgi:hypothetical protein
MLGGISELAEIASIRAHDFNVEIVGVFEPRRSRDTFVGRPVWNCITAEPLVDATIFTTLTSSNETY